MKLDLCIISNYKITISRVGNSVEIVICMAEL